MKFFVIVMFASFILSLFGFFVAVHEEVAVSLTSFEEIIMDINYNGLHLYFASFLVFIIVGPNCMFALQALVVVVIYKTFAMFTYLLYRRMKKEERRPTGPTQKNQSFYQLLHDRD